MNWWLKRPWDQIARTQLRCPYNFIQLYITKITHYIMQAVIILYACYVPTWNHFGLFCIYQHYKTYVSRSDDEETFCRTLVEYTRACSHVGYPVREWRDSFPTCGQFTWLIVKDSWGHTLSELIYVMCFISADRCEDSFVHRDCISCCPPTCTFDKECLGTNLHCLDGCYCPDGKMYAQILKLYITIKITDKMAFCS